MPVISYDSETPYCGGSLVFVAGDGRHRSIPQRRRVVKRDFDDVAPEPHDGPRLEILRSLLAMAKYALLKRLFIDFDSLHAIARETGEAASTIMRRRDSLLRLLGVEILLRLNG